VGAELGCITRWLGLSGEPSVEGTKGKIPLTKVERHLDSLAERHVTLVADACDAMERESPESDERRLAQQLKLANGTAVYDIVTRPDTLGRLADLYILIELEYMVWVQEGFSQRQFGERGKSRLAPAFEESHREMMHLADLTMKPGRQAAFDHLIRKWRDRNPDVSSVTGIRFGALPEQAGKTLLESTSSFFEVINPMEDTTQSVERSRVLADRAFFYAKHVLQLTDWQTEAALNTMLGKPEVRKILMNAERLTGSIDQTTQTIRELPDRVAKEREQFLTAWDARKGDLTEPVAEIHSAIVDAKELAVQATLAGKAFERAFRELHELVGSPSTKESRSPSEHPFDMRDVTAAAEGLTELAREGSGAVQGARGLLDLLVIRTIELVGAILALFLLYRLILVRWIKPAPPAPPSAKDRRPATSFETRHGSPT
jgi:hypothetical protein